MSATAADHIRVTLPDGNEARGAAGRDAAGSRRAHRAAARAGRAGGEGRRADRGPEPPARARRAAARSSRRRTPRRSTCCATPPRTSSPRPCARCARRRRSASARRSSTASTTTSRSTEPFTPEELAGDRGADDARSCRCNDPVRAHASSPGRRRASCFADDPLKLERLEEFGEDEVITIYRNGPFLDLCRGPHVPRHGRPASTSSCCPRRAPTGAATSAARCSSASTARPGSRRRTSRSTSAPRGGQAARPPQARP